MGSHRSVAFSMFSMYGSLLTSQATLPGLEKHLFWQRSISTVSLSENHWPLEGNVVTGKNWKLGFPGLPGY